MRLKRTMQSWKSSELPPVVTHDLCDQDNDEILNYLNGVRTGLMILHNHLEIQASAVIAALQKQNKARGIQPN